MTENLESTISTILIGIVAAAAMIVVKGWKTKDGKSKISATTFFILGFLFTPLGIISLVSGMDGAAFFALGIIYLTIGMILNKKNRVENK